MKCAFFSRNTTWTYSNHLCQQFNVICLYRPHRHVWVNDDSFSFSISLWLCRARVWFICSKEILFTWMVVIPHTHTHTHTQSLSHAFARLFDWYDGRLEGSIIIIITQLNFDIRDSIQSNQKVVLNGHFLVRKQNYCCWLFGWKGAIFSNWKNTKSVAFEICFEHLNSILVFFEKFQLF